MAVRNWIGNSGDAFNTVADWSPSGTPSARDTANITSGTVNVAGETLDGLLINLGGLESANGNSPTSIVNVTSMPTGYGGFFAPTPNPTLTLENGTIIGPATLIEMPTSPIGLGQVNGATIWMQGSVVNYGTIGLPTNPGLSNQQMNFVADDTSGGEFINDGTINIPQYQRTNFTGTSTPVNPFFVGVITNNGIINVYGTMEDTSAPIAGGGTISLDAISSNIGLPTTVGTFILDLPPSVNMLDPTQHIAFAGGHLTIQGGNFESTGNAEIQDFGANPLDQIAISDFTLSSTRYSNGQLTLDGSDGANAASVTLNFANLPSTGNWLIAQEGTSVDIQWQQPSAAPVGPIHNPVHNPIHPPPGPPGHALM